MQTIKERYGLVATELIKNSKHSSSVTSDKVFQEANAENRALIDQVVKELLLPGSRIDGIEELVKLYSLAQQGKSCLLLSEHYSNFDIPTLHYLISESPQAGRIMSDRIIPMAGMKLNAESDFVRAFTEAYTRLVIYPSRSLQPYEGTEQWAIEKKKSRKINMAGMKLNAESDFVRAFTEAYTRLVIYPSRSLQPYEGTEQWAIEKKKSRKINMAALHEMVRRKHDGDIILLFPSGTRYRPGDEASRRGLPEVDSYLRAFDYVLPIGVSGNILRVNQQGTMAEDFVTEDVVIYKTGTITPAEDYRTKARETVPTGAESAEVKQRAADLVMESLKDLHLQARTLRLPLLPENHPPDEDGYEAPGR
jgi:glycerol-3-phosphate O-acyltransferase